MRTLAVAAVTVLATLAMASTLDAAPKRKDKSGGDRSWTHPQFGGFGVDRIAMIPVVTYNNDLPSEKQVEGIVGQALHESGFRWISAGTTRELLRVGNENDSLLKVIRGFVLKDPRVDSLMAPGLCRRLRCDALLTVRIDQWEKREIEYDQTGKPSTTVQLKAALVDSSGALLWSVASNETAEGPYHEANANPVGMSGGDLQRKPVTGQGGAPDFVEVVTSITKRWTSVFPMKSASTAGAADSLKTPPKQ